MSTPAHRPTAFFPHRHLLGIEGLSAAEITRLLDLANTYADLPKDDERAREAAARAHRHQPVLRELDAHAHLASSWPPSGWAPTSSTCRSAPRSVKKGETLLDTAMTLNAMRPDVMVVRHPRIRRGQPAVAEGQLRRHQCRRRQPRASDPGAARRAHHPPAHAAGCRACWWRSAATSCTAAWRARTSTC